MKPIAIFFHCLFEFGTPPEFQPGAFEIVREQMSELYASGLLSAASHFVAGINGGKESQDYANLVLPEKAQKVLHGLESHGENLTIVEIEKWVPTHPDWYVLYFHSKGATHAPGTHYGENVSAPWRRAMMKYCVTHWRSCVKAMDEGAESVGCHFMRGMADGSQNIWAGNFFWATSNFLATLPSIYERDRIKLSGIGATESRYEAEVWIGNGPRCPNVKEFLPQGGEGCP